MLQLPLCPWALSDHRLVMSSSPSQKNRKQVGHGLTYWFDGLFYSFDKVFGVITMSRFMFVSELFLHICSRKIAWYPSAANLLLLFCIYQRRLRVSLTCHFNSARFRLRVSTKFSTCPFDSGWHSLIEMYSKLVCATSILKLMIVIRFKIVTMRYYALKPGLILIQNNSIFRIAFSIQQCAFRQT